MALGRALRREPLPMVRGLVAVKCQPRRRQQIAESMTIEAQIAQLFSKKLNLDVPSFETDLIETGSLDSLKFVELLVELEQQFGLRVSLEDLEVDNFRCIQRIADFVTAHRGVQPIAPSEKRTF